MRARIGSPRWTKPSAPPRRSCCRLQDRLQNSLGRRYGDEDPRAILDHFGETPRRLQPCKPVGWKADELDTLGACDDAPLGGERKRMGDVDPAPGSNRLGDRGSRQGLLAIDSERREKPKHMIVEDEAPEPGSPFTIDDPVDREMVARKGGPYREEQPGREAQRLGVDLLPQNLRLLGPEGAKGCPVDLLP